MAGSTVKFAEYIDEIKRIIQKAYCKKDFEDDRFDYYYKKFVINSLIELKNIKNIKRSFGEKPDYVDVFAFWIFSSVEGCIYKINEKLKFDLKKVKELLKEAKELLPKPDEIILGK